MLSGEIIEHVKFFYGLCCVIRDSSPHTLRSTEVRWQAGAPQCPSQGHQPPPQLPPQAVPGEPQPQGPGDTPHQESAGAGPQAPHRLQGVTGQGCGAHCEVRGKSIWSLYKTSYGMFRGGKNSGKQRDKGIKSAGDL